MITKFSQSYEIRATLIRADGTTEDLGVIATTKISILDKIKNFFKSKGVK